MLASGPQRVRALSYLSKELGAKAKGGADAPLEPLRIVLLRHGESEWNASKRFSGWVDIDLTDKGRLEAARAGKLLKLHGYEFDEAHASVLKRAVRTLWTALHSSNQHWIPVKHTWRLNERHYGALTGLSKTDAEEQLGKEMLLKYRRGYAVEPLPMVSCKKKCQFVFAKRTPAFACAGACATLEIGGALDTPTQRSRLFVSLLVSRMWLFWSTQHFN